MNKNTIIELVDTNDPKAVRNKNNLLDCYDMIINKKQAMEGAMKYVTEDYIQHNPLLADGAKGLGEWFENLHKERPHARVVVHKIVAIGDYLFAHVNFLNFLNDDPDDTGIAVVDMWKVREDGMMVEHWDVLQVIGDPKTNSAPWFGPNIPANNNNGVM
ncbi:MULTISPECIES: nuclear transport factor 2 family protein [unclassified Paenibacillus]|uniref:Nuclear transport factor 2 family protein n=1 Tax=Paenibacillus provencensis TaxID=441151 RepID=A0ABW3PV04_9BACL|nr:MULTISPECIES: nuclear transport factor 2 family protein [unclassified Paenibacillus]MCM3129526.1 nuclear transport factor 2 family protein [Paenibacillus sp. MER 78]SFS52863.1 Predicted SnoaL-like aldol condensation-catalyzing enzyme [Paenibacillus sp. 453mf]